MQNMRILYDNVADRNISLTTTGGISTLPVTNLLNDYKARVWRSTDSVPLIEVQWSVAQQISMVVLPYTNLSASGQMRVRCYNTAGLNAVATFDTGFLNCCPYAPLDSLSLDWGTSPLGVNAYAYGGGVYALLYFAPQANVMMMRIEIKDPFNTMGYYEAMRLLAGSYWSPTNNPSFNTKLIVLDNSKSERNDAGDLMTHRGTISKSLSLNLDLMTPNDRTIFWRIMRGRGMSKPFFISLTPENTNDPSLEQENHVYGKLVQQPTVSYTNVNIFSGTVTIEEV
jgi:hypothetical protein